MICTDENNPVIFSLSPGDAGDAPCGRELIKKLGKQKNKDICLWTKLTKTTTLDFWLKVSILNLSFHLNLTEKLLGFLIKFCINRVTTSNDFFGKLSVSGVFLLAMTNSILFFFSSFTSLSFLILYFVLTGPRKQK